MTQQQPNLTPLYAPVEPYNTGSLKVSDLHTLYYEENGNPNGNPVVFVHGGPGGGTGPDDRRFFNQQAYRIVLFDQRGSGKSTPHSELEDNHTWALVAGIYIYIYVAHFHFLTLLSRLTSFSSRNSSTSPHPLPVDMEKLREHLGIDKWVVFGGSWGSTLSLTYAIKHPKRVKALVLRGIFTLRKAELDWFYEDKNGASFIYPDAWEAYVKPIPESERGNFVAAYHRRLTSKDPAEQQAAATAWSIWECSTSRLYLDPAYVARAANDKWALAFARIENH
ncbi:Alpha/Beta hydrolase protein [Jimgerdemannia flammicorona]|uniref:prolyl aminopeptidase n=1 Tax=Jimgerdemannia flammicorona TaxID=994334 RepID=A0A433A200_9FUNG|nr:Alpha/Beta hydrolase protein [Jimgerdemannia flammicorona]